MSILNIETAHIASRLAYGKLAREHLSDFQMTQVYINNTSEHICVIHRNNLPITVFKSAGAYGNTGELIMRTIYKFNNRENIVKLITNLKRYEQKYTMQVNDLNIIGKVLLDAFSADACMYHVEVILDRHLDMNLINNNGALYIQDLDVLVTKDSSSCDYIHPYSAEGQILGDQQKIIKDDKVSGVFVQLVDNEHNVNKRYLHVAKDIIEIPAIKDPNKKSGVYFTKAQYCDRNDATLEPSFYEFDEAESKLGLYKTREEAMSGGDPTNIVKLECDKAQRELFVAKRQLDETIAAHLREKAELEHELFSRKHDVLITKENHDISKVQREDVAGNLALTRKLEEFTREIKSIKKASKVEKKKLRRKDRYETKDFRRKDYYEDRNHRRDDYYDSRGHDRKDNSEVIKTAALVVTSGISIWALMTKFK